MAEVMQCTLPPKQLCQGLSKKKVSLTIVVSEVCEVVCQLNDGMQYNWLGSTDMCSHLRKGSFALSCFIFCAKVNRGLSM